MDSSTAGDTIEQGGCSEVIWNIFWGVLHLVHVGVRDPKVADDYLFLEFGESSSAFFDVFIRFWPLELAKVNDIYLETT